MTEKEIISLILQYPHIRCVKLKIKNGNHENGLWTPIEIFEGFTRDYEFSDIFEYIELRSISSLTDQEYSELLVNCGVFDLSGNPEKHQLKEQLSGSINGYQYLVSIGIIIKYRGFSIGNMINEGVLKLK